MATQNLMQIKRSETTAVPASLANGELAFSGNGDVLFVGNFGSVLAIGGARNPGVLTANQAIVANSTGGVDALDTDSLTVNNYAVTSIIDSDTMSGASNTSLASSESIKAYVDSQVGSVVSSFTITGDSGTDTFETGQTLDFAGNTGITTTVSNNQVDIDLNDTAVSPGSYGDANTVATFTVDQQGRLTAAAPADIDHDLLKSFVPNEHIDHSNVSITAGNGLTGGGNITTSRTLTVGAGDGISVNSTAVGIDIGTGETALVANSDGLHLIDSNLTIATSQLTGNYVATLSTGDGLTGSSSTSGGTPTIALDVSGDTSLVANATGLHVVDSTLSIATSQLTGNFVSDLSGTTNEITVSGSTGSITIGLPDDVTIGRDLTVTGNLVVSGTTTTVDTTQLLIEDNLIGLASNNSTDSVDFGFYGRYDDTGIKYAGLYRDASDGTGVFKLFDSLATEPTGTTITGGSLAALDVGALSAGATSLSSLSLTTDLAVTHGGTGASSFTDNGIIYGNGTGALSVTAAGTQYQVLQAGAGGVPEFGSLDGGTF